jgi:hypothetical protein
MKISIKSITRKAAVLSFAGVIAMSATIPAFAADNISQGVTAGNFTGAAGLSAAPTFASISSTRALQNKAATNATVPTLTVDDASGATAGWSVTMVASDLVDTETGNYTILATAVSVALGTGVPTNGADFTNVTQTDGALDTGLKVLSAAADTTPSGTYVVPALVSIAVPANVHTGTYAGSITTTTVQTP